jgi:hypothetical protein
MPAAHVPTDEARAAVKRWAAAGVSQEIMADAVGIAVETLVKHYGVEIAEGRPKFKADFSAVFNTCALDPDPKHNVLRIFLSKVLLGYRETVAIDPTKEVAPNELSDAELRARIAERARAARLTGS